MFTRIMIASISCIAAVALTAPVHALPVSPMAAPQIDGVSPGFGGPGDVIEITGRGFFNDGVPPTVTFLSLYGAEVEGWNDSRITVIVPVVPDAPEGFIELKVSTAAGSDVAPFRYYASPPGDLGMPVGLKGKALKGKVRLTWSPPTQGASTVTEYQWRFQQRGKAWSPWKKSAKGAEARQQVVKRIRPRQAYVFQVRAMAGSTEGPAATTPVTGR